MIERANEQKVDAGDRPPLNKADTRWAIRDIARGD